MKKKQKWREALVTLSQKVSLSTNLEEDSSKQCKRNLEYLQKEIMMTITSILRENPYESGMDQGEVEGRLREKKELRKALKHCVFGDKNSKIYIKDYIKTLLLGKYKLSNESIEEAIPFSRKQYLTCQDKFEILLYWYEKEYHLNALEQIIEQYQLAQPKYDKQGSIYFEITKEDIETIYERIPLQSFTFMDKLNIVTQRIYQNYKGNGSIDILRDMKIDGISGGVSGIPEGFHQNISLESKIEYKNSYDSIWIFYHGKSIHLSFLGFHSQKELIRICKNIYRYDNPGQLSEVKGYIVNEMMDGSRVAVARPPFCESWVFFIRKFDTVLQENMEKLITDKNKELPIQFIKWLVKGCQIIGITGEQGSGKTTILMSMIGFIHPTYNLRIQELSFELHLRKIYPNRNIVTFRETASITGQEGLDFQKKSDGAVNILGEVASAPVSAWLVQMAQVASLFTLFTHHAKTTENLVTALRNALLQEGGFHNERIATEQVVDAINFDIHMKKDVNGHRYIERITEIVPKKEIKKEKDKGLTAELFETNDILYYKNGAYYRGTALSNRAKEAIYNMLNEKEREEFSFAMEEWERED